RVVMRSGRDTTLQGAVVKAPTVVADVARDLNLESLQDTSTYTSRQRSAGGSVSVGYGQMGGSLSANASNIDSTYASVAEQSGIKAGDGGFQVTVGGDTNLRGGVI
ncbi:hemagglutinin repeat-containing protein, partial [Ramlibacter sp. AN1015]|uniref:hemagglutinin repeat-containing protein n=1 Tax=Ramlibacter sp. AN1015 TaxID=3133428 RepID=UPI0030BE9D1A